MRRQNNFWHCQTIVNRTRQKVHGHGTILIDSGRALEITLPIDDMYICQGILHIS